MGNISRWGETAPVPHWAGPGTTAEQKTRLTPEEKGTFSPGHLTHWAKSVAMAQMLNLNGTTAEIRPIINSYSI